MKTIVKILRADVFKNNMPNRMNSTSITQNIKKSRTNKRQGKTTVA